MTKKLIHNAIFNIVIVAIFIALIVGIVKVFAPFTKTEEDVREKTIQYKGHDFIIFTDNYNQPISIEHDPECKKCFNFFD